MGTIGAGEFRSHLSEPSIAGKWRFKHWSATCAAWAPGRGAQRGRAGRKDCHGPAGLAM